MFSPVKPTGFLRVINLIFRYINSRTGSSQFFIKLIAHMLYLNFVIMIVKRL
jgi:hypothetical protein